jgi:LysR family hydrogen peroxide-inducible transcriptional activator
MVAAGMGVTLVPRLSVAEADILPPKSAKGVKGSKAGKAGQGAPQPLVRYLPFESSEPTRRVVRVWRRSFTRYEAVAALRNAIYACPLPGVRKLT